jgi:hypothetical protein
MLSLGIAETNQARKDATAANAKKLTNSAAQRGAIA